MTGESLGRWALFGSPTALNQSSPWGIRIAPTGNVFVVRTGEEFGSGGGGGHPDDNQGDELHLTNAQIYEFDARNGNFIRVHIGGNDHSLEFPTGFDFMPGWDLDCNLNLLPDDCDIASGTSVDDDGSGVPDECEIDCNTNGVFDRFDIIPFGASRDCNANMIPDECDLASAFSLDDNENGVPDECDIDCNANLVPDDLDIQNGTSMDCDANGVPDECDPDCNNNGAPDACDISGGTSEDCDENGVPDECDPDCNNNGAPDACDISSGASEDCNGSGVPDECELQNADCNENMIPDECDPDCDADGIPDDCDGEVLFHDDFEQDLGWTTANLGATSGDWERGVPVNDSGWNHDPFSDSDGSGQCYLTENALGNTDVDGGAVALISPIIDMSIGSITIQYDFFLKLTEDGQGTDWLRVEINSTGGVGDWIQIAQHDTNGGLAWRTHAITPDDLDALGVETTNSMVLRFIANDGNPQSIVEAALDAFFVLTAALDCNETGVPDTCETIANGDYNGDGAVTLADWTAFAQCMAGPDVPPTHPITQCVDACLAAFDADLDGDVDMGDFGTFMTVFDAP